MGYITRIIRRRNAETKPRTISPAAQEMIDTYGLNADEITGTGANGNVTKKDVTKYMKQHPAADAAKGEEE